MNLKMNKQETLEEAALSFLPRSEVDNDTDFITGFEFGAKWQSERVDREIEEAAANLADPNICKTDNWIAGAKYQAERMYSKEEVEKIISKLMNEVHSGDICYGDKIIDFKISPKKWFEQFKKK
jgi:predicted porin